jgi:hypothetical protein
MNHARLAPGIVVAALLLPGLAGCIARTAVDVVTAPVKVAGKAVDLATTSQSEADEKRGRELREREERIGRLERKRAKLHEDCQDGDAKACRERDAVSAEIENLLATP